MVYYKKFGWNRREDSSLEERMEKGGSMKTIVVKINGKWQLIKVEAGRIFTGEDHNMKAIKYFDKKVKENNDN